MTRSPSMFKPVPLEWVEKLFDRMTAIYGPRAVADLWDGADLSDVHAVWAVELGKLSAAQLGAGVQTMAETFKRPPNLGELMAHCRAARVQPASNPQLTDNRRADPATQREGMAKFRAAVAPLANRRVNPGSAWAHRLLQRGTSASGGALPPEVVRIAKDAIRNHSRKGGNGGNDDNE
jgi:hypothetical protein